jgi:hypothetical protein
MAFSPFVKRSLKNRSPCVQLTREQPTKLRVVPSIAHRLCAFQMRARFSFRSAA